MNISSTYDDRKFRYLHPADQIVLIMERIYNYGMTTTSGGNISIRDSDGTIWVTPGGIDKGGLTRKDIVQVPPEGNVMGPHPPSSEFPFHRAVYQARPDISAVLHAHPPALVAFSASGKIPATNVLPNTRLICGEIGFAPYALPGSEALGENIAARFADGHDIVILENHGIVTGAEDLFRAFMQFETLDFTARIQIEAAPLGVIRPIAEEHRTLSSQRNNDLPEFVPESTPSREKELRREMCELISRSYDQGLFTSTEGTFAVRLDESAFLITPYGYDRKYLRPDDIVLIQGTTREAGKRPSRSVMLHRTIFDRHSGIAATIIAHPPSLMAFNVTRTTMDTRVIPEAYILLRDIGFLPFEAPMTDFEQVADALGEAAPLVMVENNGVIVTGDSLLKTFDRLEVAEFSAKAVLGALRLGTVKAMDDAEIQDLAKAFGLKFSD